MRHVTLLGLLPELLAACGETVNYETREKMISSAELNAGGPASSNIEVGGADSANAELNPCTTAAVQQQKEILHFPEIAAGTTCSFASGDNLSRKDGFIRAYMK
jgi:hypothetical protein